MYGTKMYYKRSLYGNMTKSQFGSKFGHHGSKSKSPLKYKNYKKSQDNFQYLKGKNVSASFVIFIRLIFCVVRRKVIEGNDILKKCYTESDVNLCIEC